MLVDEMHKLINKIKAGYDAVSAEYLEKNNTLIEIFEAK